MPRHHGLSFQQRLAYRLRLLAAPHASVEPRRAGNPTVVGLFGSASGTGESARLCHAALARAGTEPVAVDLTSRFHTRDRVAFSAAAATHLDDAGGPVIVHVNPPALPTALLTLERRSLSHRYVVGCWSWELPAAPAAWRHCESLVHEIWVPSRFVAQAIAPLVKTPLRIVPHPVTAPTALPAIRARFGIPEDALLILCVADIRSSLARKNPAGAIAAFCRAFGDKARYRLILKLSGLSDAATHANVRAQLAPGPTVQLITEDLGAAEMDGLVVAADIVISLHRAEGFGLTPAKAMLAGKPVVMTGWSGVLDFADQNTAALVGYRLVAVHDPQAIYIAPGQSWADPDIDEAATWLVRLGQDAGLRTRLGEIAKKRAGALFSLERYIEACGLPFAASRLPASSVDASLDKINRTPHEGETAVATFCTHLKQVHDVQPRTPEGCEECLKTNGRWVHLRLCLVCGHVGCCDQSPGKHATMHFHQSQHAIIRSFEPGEDWGWCYVDELMIEPAPRPR